MYKYTDLTFTELVNKIGSSRYFNLPAMLKEILSRLTPQAPKYKNIVFNVSYDNSILTVNELDNTIGDITITKPFDGTIQLESDNLFTLNKIAVLLGFAQSAQFDLAMQYEVVSQSLINIYAGNTATTSPTDSALTNNSTVEIRVYN